MVEGGKKPHFHASKNASKHSGLLMEFKNTKLPYDSLNWPPYFKVDFIV